MQQLSVLATQEVSGGVAATPPHRIPPPQYPSPYSVPNPFPLPTPPQYPLPEQDPDMWPGPWQLPERL
jgi:hypothetical protein